MRLRFLAVRPHFISSDFAAGVFEGVIVVHDHLAGDAFDDGLETGRLAMHLVGGDDVGKATMSIGAHDYFCRGEVTGDRVVAIVPQVRRNEDEGKDQRDHYIVMEAASLIRPEKIAFEDTAHRSTLYCNATSSTRTSLRVLAHPLFRGDDCLAAHVRYQRIRHAHGAVSLLIVFENGEPGAAYGKSAAVQGVEKLVLPLALGAIADIGTAGLEGLEVGA